MIYQHRVLRVNYTTYDMRRDQDSLNPQSHPDIMLLSHEDKNDDNWHPYWYARVIRIFHANVRHTGPDSNSMQTHRMDFLWVHWFAQNEDNGYHAGWKAHRLPWLSFVESDFGLSAFGFIDPHLVVRRVHLIPGFGYGGIRDPSESQGQEVEDDPSDYYFLYYINM